MWRLRIYIASFCIYQTHLSSYLLLGKFVQCSRLESFKVFAWVKWRGVSVSIFVWCILFFRIYHVPCVNLVFTMLSRKNSERGATTNLGKHMKIFYCWTLQAPRHMWNLCCKENLYTYIASIMDIILWEMLKLLTYRPNLTGSTDDRLKVIIELVASRSVQSKTLQNLPAKRSSFWFLSCFHPSHAGLYRPSI